MKSKKTIRAMLIMILALFVVSVACNNAAAMSTAFTYQGWLMERNRPANDFYDFQFALFDDPNELIGLQVGATFEVNDVDVIDGHFVIGIDFGDVVFDGNDRWLETAVRPGASTNPNDFVTLAPRYQIRPVPYALYATSGTPGPEGPIGPQGIQGIQGIQGEPIRRKHPTAVENVLSDHDVARITGSKEEADPGDAAAGSDAVEEKAVKEADAGHQSKDQEQAAEPVEESKEEAAAAESGHEGIDEHSEQAAEAPDEEAQAEADSEKSEDKAEEQEDKG